MLEIFKNESDIYYKKPWHNHESYLGLPVGAWVDDGEIFFYPTPGFLFKQHIPTQEPMLHRWGLYYTIKDFYYFGLNRKVHGKTADFLDFRVGISL